MVLWSLILFHINVSPSLLWETFPLKISRLESDLFGLKIRFDKNTPNRIFGFNLLHNVLYLIMLFRFHATTNEDNTERISNVTVQMRKLVEMI